MKQPTQQAQDHAGQEPIQGHLGPHFQHGQEVDHGQKAVLPLEAGQKQVKDQRRQHQQDGAQSVGEVEEAVGAADAAIIVVSGKAGVQVGTQKAWNLCEKYKLPRMIFVTDMDVDDVSYRKVVEMKKLLQC